MDKIDELIARGERGEVVAEEFAGALQDRLAQNTIEEKPNPTIIKETYRAYVEEVITDPNDLERYNDTGLIPEIPFATILIKLMREGKIRDLGPLKGRFNNNSEVIYYNNGTHDVLEAGKYSQAEFDVCTIPNIVGLAYIDNENGTREMTVTSLQDLMER
jgi:hypothetical protein